MFPDMPHLTLEYSANVKDSVDHQALMKRMHEALIQFESFKIQDIKSRCVRHEVFYAADGEARRAFAHLRLELLSGRPTPLKQEIGAKLLELMKSAFPKTYQEMTLDLSFEIRDMARDAYFKEVSNPTE